MEETDKNLLSILLYFDVFSYPLTWQELRTYAGIKEESNEVFELAIKRLLQSGFIRESAGYVYLGNHTSIIARRIQGNNKARQRMQAAKRYSRIISWFPFVRGVFLSGSISKNYMNKRDDIDYFIITAPGRLWLTRTLLILFKKIFLLNSYRNFCINYFTDTKHLVVHQHNRFTATEIVFLIPMYGCILYNDLLNSNHWIKQYYPSFRQDNSYCQGKSLLLKRWMEKLFNNVLGTHLDDWLFSISNAYIRKKFRHMDKHVFQKCFTVQKHELRYLPGCQQSRIMNRYWAKMKIFKRRNGIELLPKTMNINS